MMSGQHTIISQKIQADLVNDEIEALLAALSDVTVFYDILRKLLARVISGAATEASSYKAWYLLPVMISEAISDHYERAIPASAALRLFMAAGEVFDDIEDADAPGSLPAKYGSAIATNIATAFLILAERAIVRLKNRGVADSVTVRIMDSINSFYAGACCGQHLDLSLASGTSVTEDIYLRVASMKSASTMECACHIGALLATTNRELIDSFTLFGHNLGMASQIANDIHGITSGNDIVKRRITLPVVFALAHTEGAAHDRLKYAFIGQLKPVLNFEQIRDLLFESGAIHYTMVKMNFFKQLALDILYELEKAGTNIEKLRLFLE